MTRENGKIAKWKSFCTQSQLLICSFWFHSFSAEKERELCVRERLAEDKVARAESLLKNYSLLKEQKLLSLASGPGMRISPAGGGCGHARDGRQWCLRGCGSPFPLPSVSVKME